MTVDRNEPTGDFKVDQVRFPTLRDSDLQVYQSDQNITATHVPTGVSVEADTRYSADENWLLAQEALSQAVEHKLSSWSKPE